METLDEYFYHQKTPHTPPEGGVRSKTTSTSFRRAISKQQKIKIKNGKLPQHPCKQHLRVKEGMYLFTYFQKNVQCLKHPRKQLLHFVFI